MRVTDIQAVTKTRFKVYVDGQFAFVLYKGELFRYHLEEGEELSEEDYREIKETIVTKRAKLRALHLLNNMDRTEHQLRDKLKAGGYTEDVVEAAIAYVKSFGYIDDERYARQFVNSKKGTKSRREIYMLLSGKGLDASIIEQAVEEEYETEDTHEAIRRILRKKRFHPEEATDQEKQKIFAALARKGFRYEDIRQVIQISEWDT